jgi:hypothetical protein
MTATRALAWAVVTVMTATIVFGLANGGFGDDAAAIWGLPWGKVTLVDLYAGLAIFGAWIALRESRPLRVGIWWVALITLGNLAAGVYLVKASLDARTVTELLTGKDPVG